MGSIPSSGAFLLPLIVVALAVFARYSSKHPLPPLPIDRTIPFSREDGWPSRLAFSIIVAGVIGFLVANAILSFEMTWLWYALGLSGGLGCLALFVSAAFLLLIFAPIIREKLADLRSRMSRG